MNKHELLEKLQQIQQSLKEGEELGRKRLEEIGEELMHSLDNAIRAVDLKVDMAAEVRKRRPLLRQWRMGFFKSLRPVSWAVRHLLSMPFIYAMMIPALILHLFLEIFQQVGFRLYGIPRVGGRAYFVLDRARLPYLNWLEKINCLYCSYVNNLFRFAVEIGGRTERYWCPIKYANRMTKNHSQYELFIDYLEAETFREKWDKLRDFSDIRLADARRKAEK